MHCILDEQKIFSTGEYKFEKMKPVVGYNWSFPDIGLRPSAPRDTKYRQTCSPGSTTIIMSGYISQEITQIVYGSWAKM